MIINAFKEVLPEVLGAYEKIRFKGPRLRVFMVRAPDYFTVLEDGVLYQVFMNIGLWWQGS